MIEYPLLFVFPAAMVFAAVMDLLTMTIPNRISLALLAAFLVAAPLAGLDLESFAIHVGIGFAVLLAGMVLFSLGWLGGGDAKLMAASALWIGPSNLLLYFVQMSILGGALALLLLAYRRLPLAALPLPEWALRLHNQGTGIPYGVAIAGAALLIYPKTPFYAAFLT